MDAPTIALYGILAAQGVAWVVGHCPGMCGPLVLGIGFRGLPQLLLYQAGKAVTYAVLGALAGVFGGVALLALQRYAPALLLTVAVLMLLAGVRGLFRRSGTSVAVPEFLQRAVRRFTTAHGGAFALGLILGFLPCGVVIWALGLAIASAHPVHGALLMVGVIVLNTPVLAAIQLTGKAAGMARVRARWWWLPPLTLILAGGWLIGVAPTVGAPQCR